MNMLSYPKCVHFLIYYVCGCCGWKHYINAGYTCNKEKANQWLCMFKKWSCKNFIFECEFFFFKTGLVCESEPVILAFLSQSCWYLDQTNARIQGLTACINVGLLSVYDWLWVWSPPAGSPGDPRFHHRWCIQVHLHDTFDRASSLAVFWALLCLARSGVHSNKRVSTHE